MDSNYTDHNWYVVYTYPKAERKVDRKLREIGMTTFLPLHKVIRQWSDRKKKLEVPLFPNYVFVYTTHRERFEIFKVNEVVRIVSFEGQPAIISESTVSSLKKLLKGENVEVSNEEFQEGAMMKIIDGQFAGVEGVLIKKNRKGRLLLKIEVLHTYVSADIGADNVEATQG